MKFWQRVLKHGKPTNRHNSAFPQVAAQTLLRSSAHIIEREADQQNATLSLAGVFQNRRSNVHVNLQTAEVFLGGKSSMPFPGDVRPYVEDIFANNRIPACRLTSRYEYCKEITLIHNSEEYIIHKWEHPARVLRPRQTLDLKPKGKAEQVESGKPRQPMLGGFELWGEKAAESDAPTPSHGFCNYPYVGPDCQVRLFGHKWVEQKHLLSDDCDKKHSRWRRTVVDMLQEAEIPWETARVYEREECLDTEAGRASARPECGRFLVAAAGSLFEIWDDAADDVLRIFSFYDAGRTLQRALLWCSDVQASLRCLNADTPREVLTPADENSMPTLPAAALEQPEGSVMVQRQRSEMHKGWESTLKKHYQEAGCGAVATALEEAATSMTETFLNRFLTGLLPDGLLNQYQLWRLTSPGEACIVRGYPKVYEGEEDVQEEEGELNEHKLEPGTSSRHNT